MSRRSKVLTVRAGNRPNNSENQPNEGRDEDGERIEDLNEAETEDQENSSEENETDSQDQAPTDESPLEDAEGDEDENGSEDTQDENEDAEGDENSESEDDNADDESDDESERENRPKYAHRSVAEVFVSRQRSNEKVLKRLATRIEEVAEFAEAEDLDEDEHTTKQVVAKTTGSGSTIVKILVNKILESEKKVDLELQEEFADILELAVARENTYLYGPTGSGKTFLAEQVAKVLELPFFAQPASQGMDETVVTGRILPKSSSEWIYHASTFVKFYEFGGVFCLDEIDKADPNLLTFMNTALSNNFFFNELDEGRRVDRHKNFHIIATANSAGHGGSNEYFGEELDLSTLRRFQTGMVFVGYDKNLERKLLKPAVFVWGQCMRYAIDKHQTERLNVSTGFLIKISGMLERFNWKRARWEKSFFAGRTTDEVNRLTKTFNTRLNDIEAKRAKL